MWIFIAIVLIVAVVALLLAFVSPWGGSGYYQRRRVIVEREVPVIRERIREVPVERDPYPAGTRGEEYVRRYPQR